MVNFGGFPVFVLPFSPQGMLPEVWSQNFQTKHNNNFEHSDSGLLRLQGQKGSLFEEMPLTYGPLCMPKSPYHRVGF